MPSGEFVGIVADNPDQKIKLKISHCEIQNDHEAIRKEEKNHKHIPIIKKVTETDILENYLKIKSDINKIFQAELNRISTINNKKYQEDNDTSNAAPISM